MDYLDIDNWLNQNASGFGTNKLYVDFPDLIAQKAAALTIGNGLIFNSKDKKIQQTLSDWYTKNDVLTKLRKGEYVASKWGKEILYLSPSKDHKNIMLCQVKNNYQARVAKVNEEEQVAEIWTQDYQGDMPIFTLIKYTPDSIITQYYTQTTAQIGSTVAPVQDELQPLSEPYVWKNPFGIMPVVEIENLVVNNIWNQTYYNLRPDWLSVANVIEAYQITHRISVVETKSNRTRYIGSLTPEEVKKIQSGESDYSGAKDLMGDAYLNVGFDDAYGHNTQGSGLTIAEGNPKLQEYTQRLDALEIEIFNGSGYSPYKNNSNGDHQNKESANNQFNLDLQTTKTKRGIRQEKFYRLFDFVLMFYGLNPYDSDGIRQYSFSYINVGITDQRTNIEDTKQLLDMGLISQVEARSRLLDEPMDLAQEQLDQVRDDIDNMTKRQMALEQDSESETDNNEKDLLGD